MEAIGGITSILQLADQVRRICDFFASVHDAPADILEILQDMHTIQSIVEELANEQKETPAQFSALGNILEKCKAKVDGLESLLAGFDLASSSRRRRKWASIKAVLKKDSIEKLQKSLESTKTSLILARQLAADHHHRSSMTLISTSTADLKGQQSNVIRTTIAAHSELIDVKSHLRDVHKEVREMARNVEAWSRLPLLGTELEAAMTKVATNAFSAPVMQKAISNLLVSNRRSRSRPGAGYSDRFTEANEESRGSYSDQLQDVQFKVTVQRRGLRRRIVQRYYEKVECFIGTIYYHSQIVRVTSFNGDSKISGPEAFEIETSFSIIPATWLLKYGVTLSFGRNAEGYHHKMRYFPLVQRNALIFEFCQQGNIDGVQLLFQQKMASPWDTDPDGLTPLHIAAGIGNPGLCQLLVEHGAPINAVDCKYYHTPFHKLMWYSQKDEDKRFQVGRLLLENGSDLSIEDHKGWLPYTVGTASMQQSTTHHWLLQQGAGADFDPTGRDCEGFTTLLTLLSVVNFESGVAIIDLMIRLGSDVDAYIDPGPFSYYQFYAGRTALHLLVYRALTGRVLKPFNSHEQFGKLAKLLFDKGANPHTLSKQGYSPTTLALRQYNAFHWWRESLRDAGYDLEWFIRKECKLPSKMIRQGWNYESLLALFKHAFPPQPRSSGKETAAERSHSWWRSQVEEFYPREGAPDLDYLNSCPLPGYTWLRKRCSNSGRCLEWTGCRTATKVIEGHVMNELVTIVIMAWRNRFKGRRSSTTLTKSWIFKARKGYSIVALVRRGSLTATVIIKTSRERYHWRMFEEFDDVEDIDDLEYVLAEQAQQEFAKTYTQKTEDVARGVYDDNDEG